MPVRAPTEHENGGSTKGIEADRLASAKLPLRLDLMPVRVCPRGSGNLNAHRKPVY